MVLLSPFQLLLKRSPVTGSSEPFLHKNTEAEEVVLQLWRLELSPLKLPLFKRRILYVSRIFVFFNVGIVLLLRNLQV